jgi:3D (Asp-Asp-Asp) domain-containing protein
MLAAPVTYPFGSVIYFPGIGIGEVADRGGAIVLS